MKPRRPYSGETSGWLGMTIELTERMRGDCGAAKAEA